MMTQLHSIRALLGTAAGIAASERAGTVETIHVLRAIGHSDDPDIRVLVEHFPALAPAGPAPAPRRLIGRLLSRPKPSAPVRAAAERALAGAARAGGAPSPLDLVAALAEDPANRAAFAAARLAPRDVCEWLDGQRRAA